MRDLGAAESRLRDRLDRSRKRRPEYGFKNNKVVNEVLDRRTVMLLFSMLQKNRLAEVNGAVKAGKESVVFWAKSGDGLDVALKIYLVSTSNFKSRLSYMEGDPRFARIRRGTRNVVLQWASKEYRNLALCQGIVSTPRPHWVRDNILCIEFVGNGGRPAPTLRESPVSLDDYRETMDAISALYRRARLVHADLSEYNIFKADRLILFDFASAVQAAHPRAHEFLKRDINNVTAFFARRGLVVENPGDVYARVIS